MPHNTKVFPTPSPSVIDVCWECSRTGTLSSLLRVVVGGGAISTDYLQICHRHKSTAVTFLHVTSNTFLSVSTCFTASVQLLKAAEEGHPSPELLRRDVTIHVMLPECLLGANWKPSGPPVKVLFEPCVLSSSDFPSSSSWCLFSSHLLSSTSSSWRTSESACVCV